MTTWKYETAPLDLTELKNLGQLGWEAVGVFTIKEKRYDHNELIEFETHHVLLKQPS